MLSKNDGKIFKHNDIKPEIWFPELYRVLKKDTQCYVMVNCINLEKFLKVSRESGFLLHNVLMWHKNNVTPNRWYMKNGEYILFLRKGRAKKINNVGSKMIHDFDNIRGSKTHPTEKPLDLMKFYVANSSDVGEIVCDPFCGTASTLLASKELGRQYIGYEIDKTYYDIGVERLKDNN